jgi:hypothetical protein
MGILLKILSTIASLAATALVIIQTVRSGLFIVSIIFSVAKVIVILLFFSLLMFIMYLLLTSSKNSPIK